MAVSGLRVRGRARPRAIDSILIISATRYLNYHVITRGWKPRLDLLQIYLFRVLLPLLPFLLNVVRHRVLVLPLLTSGLLLFSLLFLLLFYFGVIRL